MSNNLELIAEAIQNADTIALISHVNPDGDTVGSVLALRHGLEQIGKTLLCFCQDVLPRTISFLPGIGDYCQESDKEAFDMAIAVDCASVEMLGTCAAFLKNAKVTAVVDHHGTNPKYCMLNAVEGDAPATTLLIYRLLKLLGIKITEEIAVCLYTGTSTDTGHFAYDSTNAETFAMMAELMQYNLPLAEIHKILFRSRSKGQVKLMADVMHNIEFSDDGKYTITKVTLKQSEECGASNEDKDGIINFGLEIEGVCITAMIKEHPEGKVKVSFRSFEPYHVDGIAQFLGGGGHACASGCTIFCSMDEAEKMVRKEIEKEISRVIE